MDSNWGSYGGSSLFPALLIGRLREVHQPKQATLTSLPKDYGGSRVNAASIITKLDGHEGILSRYTNSMFPMLHSVVYLQFFLQAYRR
jgi:hypothetical protein